MKEILIGKNIFKSFNNEKKKITILKDVNLTVESGEFLCIMGPSGSGKSTLLYSISGMDPIDQVEIIFDDKNLGFLNDSQISEIRRTKMGFVFQNPTMLKNLNLIDNICLPAMKNKNVKREEVIKKAKKLMDTVGLSGLEKREITEVSGGQLQRASICRALINDPVIIFGDEPTGSLNSKSTEEIINLLTKINSIGTTIMLVTHDPKVAKSCHRLVFMKDGKLVDEIKLLEFPEDKRLNIILNKMKELDI
ncbi:MAG: ABC transporter ATP-binding protein [Lagierella massiliensis]|nr:ABC transporter ATP-binding protein [Lagierella massiliensis]